MVPSWVLQMVANTDGEGASIETVLAPSDFNV
jgi:hypothetical protein